MANIPPGVNVFETNQSVLYLATFATFSLACVAVGVRFGSRWLTKAGRWFDDWLIVAALSISFLLVINMYFWIRAGFGKHYELYGPSIYPGFFKGLMWMDVSYAGIMVTTKLSLLALYARTFDRRSLHQPILLTGMFLGAWLIAAIVTATMQCRPTPDSDVEESCTLTSRGFPLGIWVPNMLSNAAVILLPARCIDRATLNGAQRTMLAFVFGSGVAVCAVSLVRLFVLFSQNPAEKDFTWELVPLGVWTLLECNLAIMAACLPAFRPIWDLVNNRPEAPCAPDAVESAASAAAAATTDGAEMETKKKKMGRPSWMPQTPPDTPQRYQTHGSRGGRGSSRDEADQSLLRSSLDNAFDIESGRSSAEMDMSEKR